MSQASLPPPPDNLPSTRPNDSIAQPQKGTDTGADLPGLSHVGAPASTEISQSSQRFPGTSTAQVSSPQHGYYHQTGQASPLNHAPYAYYPVPVTAWSNSWPSPYAGGTSTSSTMPYYSYNHPQSIARPASLHSTSSPTRLAIGVSHQQSPSASPPPSPPRQVRGHWDSAIREFLASAGLTQALRGFEADVIVMSPEWEQKKIPPALEGLVKNILVCCSYPFSHEASDMV